MIKAINGSHILIKDNSPVIIGNINRFQKRETQGELVLYSKIIFDFGTIHEDVFIFANNKLAEYRLSHKAPGYIREIYHECIKRSDMTESELLRLVVQSYVFKELGF